MDFMPPVFSSNFKHTLPRLLPQKEGDHSRSEWWRIYLPAAILHSLTNAPQHPHEKIRWQYSHRIFNVPQRRGGSVSRRDLNQAERNRTSLAGETK